MDPQELYVAIVLYELRIAEAEAHGSGPGAHLSRNRPSWLWRLRNRATLHLANALIAVGRELRTRSAARSMISLER